MKKMKLVIGLLLSVVALCVALYSVMNRPPAADLTLDAQVLQILNDGGCASCHSASAQMPFYAQFPVIGDVVKQDIEQGYRAFDVEPLMAALAGVGKPSAVDISKVEKVALDKRMPMPKYYLVHWGSSLTEAKRSIVLDWIRNERMDMYSYENLPAERAAEPVRTIEPLMDSELSAAAQLGKALFHDPRLSVDNTVSCATCHDLSTAGVDNHQYSHGVNDQLGGVNAPTVYNAVYNFVQFWVGRAVTLSDQAAGPPLNPVEMASESFDQIIEKLKADKEFTKEFERVYKFRGGLTQENITAAIEEFERTLVTPDSRFDKWLKGDDNAISADELEGYELFKTYDCATCHAGPNLGGLTYEPMGLRKDYFADRGTELTVEDNGRFKETQKERDRHRFKVPGLRNVEHTWPYYHDGTRETLEEAVRDMAIYQTGVELKEAEIAKIVAFLKTLTGEYQGQPINTTNSREHIHAHDDDHHM